MDVYVYKAALLCANCGQIRVIQVESTRPLPPGYPDDSDAYPQGPYPYGGGEADCPQHCDDCRKFLQNPLTDDGYQYVAEQIENRREGSDKSILKKWAEYYAGENTALDKAICYWRRENPEDWR